MQDKDGLTEAKSFSSCAQKQTGKDLFPLKQVTAQFFSRWNPLRCVAMGFQVIQKCNEPKHWESNFNQMK